MNIQIYNKIKSTFKGASAICLTGVMPLLASCSMDQSPYSEVTGENYINSEEAVNTIVVGAYNATHEPLYYEWALTEVRSDNARPAGALSTNSNTKLLEQLDQGTITTEHDWVESVWKGYYSVITRANNVLEHIDNVNGAKRNQYEGEARFLRALEYFNLVRLWGPVFIVTTKTPSDVARNMQRSTVEEVYTLIESDLERIVNDGLLPEKMQTADLGRADLIAAKALLAKVYATHYGTGNAYTDKAIALMREVLTSANVGNPQSAADLVPYAQIFSPDNEMNREIIFASRYTAGNVGLGAPFGNLFAPTNNGGNVIIGTARGYNCPSVNIFDAYPEGDLRRDITVAEKYYNATTGQWVEEGYCRYAKKFVFPITTDWDGEGDWPIIRTGDIALLYAELLNEQNGPSAEALKYLNMIHERAGLQPYSMAELGNKYDFRMAVREERRLELAFENQHWFDLLRWDDAVRTVNSYLMSEEFYNSYNYAIRPIEKWQTMLPIPISVLNINPDVAQNAGY